jgi:hypothetical protein
LSLAGTVVLLCDQFDGTPLKQGLFSRTIWGVGNLGEMAPSVVVDGVVPILDSEECRELAASGDAARREKLQSLRGNFVSEALEHMLSTADGQIALNCSTQYKPVGGGFEAVKEDVRNLTTEFQVCLQCLQKGLGPFECLWEGNGPCRPCSDSSVHCVRGGALMVVADQGADQRKALKEMGRDEEPQEEMGAGVEVLTPLRQQYGFGALHTAKSLTSALRNYHLFNGEDRICILHLTSVYCSDTEAGKGLAELCGADVFNYHDKHSDNNCYKGCQPGVRQILIEKAPVVVTTLVPECYR